MTRPGRSGAQLYRLLPEVYRSRDNGDLRAFLAACGEVLDLVRDVLEQRLADALPGVPPPGGRDAQPWVLPYLAHLLDARPVSVDDAGRRAEVDHAVGWRKHKGTFAALDEIVAVVGGFGRATGPLARVPEALAQPTTSIQEGWQRVAVTARLDRPWPRVTAGAPRAALAATTVDFRRRSRRVLSDRAPGWELLHPAGVPCFPGSAQDVLRRTPDLRAPTWRSGRLHPRRVLLFVAPEPGFFPRGWEDHGRAGGLTLSREGEGDLAGAVVLGDVEVDVGDRDCRIADTIVWGTLRVRSGRVSLANSAVESLVVDAGGDVVPAVHAEGCLLGAVRTRGLARLVGVTVLGDAEARRYEASDGLFAGDVGFAAVPASGDAPSCFRYCRVPARLLAAPRAGRQLFRCVTDRPHFVDARFGARGCGVLHPRSGTALRSGAEDGGEVGAYHAAAYALRERAVLDKLREYLPVGQVAMVIPDPTLAASLPRNVPIKRG